MFANGNPGVGRVAPCNSRARAGVGGTDAMASSSSSSALPPAPPYPQGERGGSEHSALPTFELPLHSELERKQPLLRRQVGAAGWHTHAAERDAELRRQAADRRRREDPASLRELPAKEARNLHIEAESLALAGPGLTRLVHYVLGRPVLLLALGHPLMTDEEKVPYLGTVFHPAPVSTVLGRSRAQAPECPPHEVVFHNWRDAILPLILSPALPADLLCVVFESDFRLAKDHADAVRAYDQQTDGWEWERGQAGSGTSTQQSSRAGLQQLGVPSARGRGGRTAAIDPPRGGGAEPFSWKERVVPPRGDGLRNPLLDQLVAICNQAHKRFGRGDLVWISWLGAKTKGALQPSRASTCLAISKNAAVVLTQWVNNPTTKPGHMDVMLADCLARRSAGLEELADHASFVSPSRGGFQEHTSGCEKNLLRTEEWSRGEPWLMPRRGMKDIWLAKWGAPRWSEDCWLGKVDGDLAKSIWQTFQPAELRASDEERQRFLEAQLGQPDPAWVEASFMSSTGEAEATPGSLEEPLTIEHSAVVQLAGGPQQEDEPDWADDAASVVSIPDADEEEKAEQRRKRKLAAGLAQAPRRRRSQPAPVDQEYIGVAVEATQYRKSLRRKELLKYYKFRHFTEHKDSRRRPKRSGVNTQSSTTDIWTARVWCTHVRARLCMFVCVHFPTYVQPLPTRG